jgi:hypothetical protein
MEITKSSQDIVQRYTQLYEIYKHTNKKHLLTKAENLMLEGNYEEAEKVMDSMSSKEQLLENLYKELERKPVHKTLRRVLAGKCDNLYEGLKGLFSLGTHMCIELERGNLEYKTILEELHQKIGRYLYERS